jgi:hypothetical protein
MKNFGAKADRMQAIRARIREFALAGRKTAC